VECWAFVAISFLAGTQRAEVFACLWNDIIAELKK
jgi:hypothetical protein